ncbi:MAG: hypothetical protein AB1472_03220 [Candidatus Omnitrophota bacterium]
MKHPELREGEVFFGNFFSFGILFSDRDINIGNPNMRIGKIAYDVDGNILKNGVPVFIQKSEFKKSKFKKSKFNFKFDNEGNVIYQIKEKK